VEPPPAPAAPVAALPTEPPAAPSAATLPPPAASLPASSESPVPQVAALPPAAAPAEPYVVQLAALEVVAETALARDLASGEVEADRYVSLARAMRRTAAALNLLGPRTVENNESLDW